MKWKCNNPADGDTRIVKRFLLFPHCINEEVRWLEFVKIKQKYSFNYVDSGWIDIEFIN